MTSRNVVVAQQHAALHAGMIAGRYAVVEVSDTGCGMSKAVVERIFEPFFTTKGPGMGTGLGLSTVLGIVRSLGGHVNVYSEPGNGSAFKVYLPAPLEGVVTSAEALTKACTKPSGGKGELILVVDDEAVIRTVTAQTLGAFGYRVITADDGAQAVRVFTSRRAEISLVLTDMMMPVMDGPALIVALRHIDPGIRIIAASGLNIGNYVSRATRAGVKYFLAKPYPADELATLIRTLLDEPAA